jgi:hypothetical protein
MSMAIGAQHLCGTKSTNIGGAHMRTFHGIFMKKSNKESIEFVTLGRGRY